MIQETTILVLPPYYCATVVLLYRTFVLLWLNVYKLIVVAALKMTKHTPQNDGNLAPPAVLCCRPFRGAEDGLTECWRMVTAAAAALAEFFYL